MFSGKFTYVLLLIIVLTGCASKKDYLNLPYKSEKGYIQAVIEIPAGTNLKIEYNKISKKFLPDLKNGTERKIEFLAYPANYGFIPSTFSDKKKGGDGDPLDIMVISSQIASAELVEVIPIGILKLYDNSEEDFKIIAIPADPALRNISVENNVDFVKNFKGAKEIIEIWFTSYDPEDTTEIIGWGDETEALREIERIHKN